METHSCTWEFLKWCWISLRWGLYFGLIPWVHAESLVPCIWSVTEFRDFAKRKQELGVNQGTFLSEKAEIRLHPERVKFVQQELVNAECLCSCFPAAFTKGLLLSESAPVRLSAAKSTALSVSSVPCNTCRGQCGLKPSSAFAVHQQTVKSNPRWLAHSCSKAPWQRQAVMMFFC